MDRVLAWKVLGIDVAMVTLKNECIQCDQTENDSNCEFYVILTLSLLHQKQCK